MTCFLRVAVLVCVLWPAVAHATLSVGTSTTVCGTNTITTSAINTTTAIGVVVLVGGGVDANLSDSMSNTWTALTEYQAVTGTLPRVQIHYTGNVLLRNASHTFTNTVTGNSCLVVLTLTGDGFAHAQQRLAGTTGVVATIQPGEITPVLDGALIVSGIALPAAATNPSAIGGYTTINATGASFDTHLAYKIQTSPAAENPTWTGYGSATDTAVTIAAFHRIEKYHINAEWGNDTRSCQLSEDALQPKASIKNLFDNCWQGMAPGTRVQLYGSSDSATPTIYSGATNVLDSAVTTIPTGGPPYAALRIWATHDSYVILRPPDGSPAFAFRSATASYIWIENIPIDGSLQTTNANDCLVIFSGGAHDNAYRLGDVYDNVDNGFCSYGSGTGNQFIRSKSRSHGTRGIVAESPSFMADVFETTGNGEDGFWQNGTAADTGMFQRGRSTGNCLNNTAGCANGSIGDTGADGNVIRSMVSAGSTRDGFRIRAGTGNKIYNVDATGNTLVGVHVVGGTDGEVKNVVHWNNGTNYTNAGSATVTATNLSVDPSYENAAGGDYRKLPGSAARNAGTDVSITWDIIGRERIGAYDIGAYEIPAGCPSGTCTVSSGATNNDLQEALDNARGGDQIRLAASTQWTAGVGTAWLIHPHQGTGSITLQTDITLPAPREAVPCAYIRASTEAAERAQKDACVALYEADTANYAKLITASTTPSLLMGFGVRDWTIKGLWLGGNQAYPSEVQSLLMMGLDTRDTLFEPYELGQTADNIAVEQMRFEGVVADANTKRGIHFNAINSHVKWSYFNLRYASGGDGTMIQCYVHCSDNEVGYNLMIGQAETVIVGGSSPIFVNPDNWWIHDNYMTNWWEDWTLVSWYAPGLGVSDSAINWESKNRGEVKCGTDFIWEKNIFENQWAQNQSGGLLLLTQMNQGVHEHCRMDGQIVRYNVFRNGGVGIAVQLSSPADYSRRAFDSTNDVEIHDNLFYRINNEYGHSGTNGGTCFNISSGLLSGFVGVPAPQIPAYPTNIKYDHNTCHSEGGTVFTLNNAGDEVRSLTMTNNLATGSFALNGWALGAVTWNNDSLDDFAPSSHTTANNVIGTNETNPLYNSWVETMTNFNAIFVNQAAADYTVAPGSLYKAGGSRDATDNKDVGVDMTLLPDGGGSPPEDTPARLPRLRIRLRAEASSEQPRHAGRQQDQRSGFWHVHRAGIREGVGGARKLPVLAGEPFFKTSVRFIQQIGRAEAGQGMDRPRRERVWPVTNAAGEGERAGHGRLCSLRDAGDLNVYRDQGIQWRWPRFNVIDPIQRKARHELRSACARQPQAFRVALLTPQTGIGTEGPRADIPVRVDGCSKASRTSDGQIHPVGVSGHRAARDVNRIGVAHAWHEQQRGNEAEAVQHRGDLPQEQRQQILSMTIARSVFVLHSESPHLAD